MDEEESYSSALRFFFYSSKIGLGTLACVVEIYTDSLIEALAAADLSSEEVANSVYLLLDDSLSEVSWLLWTIGTEFLWFTP